MKLFDRLSRGIRVFRMSADTRAIEQELRGIRLALECVCREEYNVELSPVKPQKPLKTAEEAYFEDGGLDDRSRVRALLAEAGYHADEPTADPLFEGEQPRAFNNDPDQPFPAFMRNIDENRDGVSPTRSNFPYASAGTAGIGAGASAARPEDVSDADGADVD